MSLMVSRSLGGVLVKSGTNRHLLGFDFFSHSAHGGFSFTNGIAQKKKGNQLRTAFVLFLLRDYTNTLDDAGDLGGKESAELAPV